MLKKKQDKQWIDGNMFWYTYGSTQKTGKDWKRNDEKMDEEDDDMSPLRRENSNGDLKTKKVTFVGRIEHEYSEETSNKSILGTSVSKLKEAKNKLTDKIKDYYHENAFFYAESIREHFEDFLEKIPFYHPSEVTTEVINTENLPQPRVLHPQDVSSNDSETTIGILVTIDDKLQPTKKCESFFSSISRKIFDNKESEDDQAEEKFEASVDLITKSLQSLTQTSKEYRGEVNNHNSLSTETTKFFVLEPLDIYDPEESVSKIEKRSFLDKLSFNNKKVDTNNTNNSNNNKYTICKNNFLSSNTKMNYKNNSYKIKRIRNDKKVILNDPNLPKQKMDSSTMVKNWMNSNEQQTSIKLLLKSSEFSSVGKESGGVSELVKRFEKSSSTSLLQISSLDIQSTICVKNHINSLDKVLFKENHSNFLHRVSLPKYSNLKNPSTQFLHPTLLLPPPPPPPLHSLLLSKEQYQKPLKKMYSKTVNMLSQLKHNKNSELIQISPSNCKRVNSATKNDFKLPKRTKHLRSSSTKSIFRDFVKKNFKLKSLSPVDKKQDHLSDYFLPFDTTPPHDRVVSNNVGNIVNKSGVNKIVNSGLKEPGREKNNSARKLFFALPDRQENVSRNNHSFHFGSFKAPNFNEYSNCVEPSSKNNNLVLNASKEADLKQMSELDSLINLPVYNQNPNKNVNRLPVSENKIMQNSEECSFTNNSLIILKDPIEESLLRFYEKSKNVSFDILNSGYDKWKQDYGMKFLSEFERLNGSSTQNSHCFPHNDSTLVQNSLSYNFLMPSLHEPNHKFEKKKIQKQKPELHQELHQKKMQRQQKNPQHQLQEQHMADNKMKQLKLLEPQMQQLKLQEQQLKEQNIQNKQQKSDHLKLQPLMNQQQHQRQKKQEQLNNLKAYQKLSFKEHSKQPLETYQSIPCSQQQIQIHHNKHHHSTNRQHKKQHKHHSSHIKPVYQVNSTVFTVFDRVINQLKDEELRNISERLKKNNNENEINTKVDFNESWKDIKSESDNVSLDLCEIEVDNNDSSGKKLVKSMIQIFEPTF